MHKPDVMFILETMVSSTNIERILPKSRFQHFDYVDPVNHSSGIAVLWNNDSILAFNSEKRSTSNSCTNT